MRITAPQRRPQSQSRWPPVQRLGHTPPRTSLGAWSVSATTTAGDCTGRACLQGLEAGWRGPVVPSKVESQRAGHTALHELPLRAHGEGRCPAKGADAISPPPPHTAAAPGEAALCKRTSKSADTGQSVPFPFPCQTHFHIKQTLPV